MRHFDSVWARTTVSVSVVPNTVDAAANASGACPVVAIEDGQYGHFSGGAPTSVLVWFAAVLSAMLIAQWCFPFLRQHTGTLASAVCPNASSGAISEKLNTRSNAMEVMRDMTKSYYHGVGAATRNRDNRRGMAPSEHRPFAFALLWLQRSSNTP
jgi:hypothetical protein